MNDASNFLSSFVPLPCVSLSLVFLTTHGGVTLSTPGSAQAEYRSAPERPDYLTRKQEETVPSPHSAASRSAASRTRTPRSMSINQHAAPARSVAASRPLSHCDVWPLVGQSSSTAHNTVRNTDRRPIQCPLRVAMQERVLGLKLRVINEWDRSAMTWWRKV